MEFTTLTRRVAEFSGVDAAEIEADAALAGGAPRGARRDRRSKRAAAPGAARNCRSTGRRSRATLRQGPGERRTVRSSRRRCWPSVGPKRRARPRSTGRSYETVRTRGRLERWIARARDPACVAHRHRASPASIRCRRSCAASRSRSRRARPATCRSATARAARAAPAAVRGELAPDQMSEATALAGVKPLLEDPGVLKIGQTSSSTWQMLRAARHRDRALRRHHADLLRARRRTRRPRHGRARRALPRAHRRRPQRRCSAPARPQVTFDAGPDRARPPNMPPRTPT